MAVSRRSPTRFEVYVYTPATQCKRYVGSFPDMIRAREVERLAKLGEYVPIRQASVSWTLNAKGETACRVCDGDAKHLHHTVPAASLGDRDECPFKGGVPLCTSCHMGWHHNAVTIFRDVLLLEEVAYVLEVMGAAWLDTRYPARELYAQDVNQGLIDETVRLRQENRDLKRQLLGSPFLGRES